MISPLSPNATVRNSGDHRGSYGWPMPIMGIVAAAVVAVDVYLRRLAGASQPETRRAVARALARSRLSA